MKMREKVGMTKIINIRLMSYDVSKLFLNVT